MSDTCNILAVHMNKKRIIAFAVLLAISGLTLLASCAQPDEIAPTDRTTVPMGGSARGGVVVSETVTVAADEPIPNLPGKRLVAHIVDYAPGAVSASHHHAPSAFIYAYVLSGEIQSQVDDEPARVSRAGETWFENPGSHHRVSANASATNPARLLAVIIVDVADDPIVIPDHS